MSVAENNLNRYAGGQAEIITSRGHYRGEIERVLIEADIVRLVFKWTAVQHGRNWQPIQMSQYNANLSRVFSGSYGDSWELRNLEDGAIVRLYPQDALSIRLSDIKGRYAAVSSENSLEDSMHTSIDALRIPGVMENTVTSS